MEVEIKQPSKIALFKSLINVAFGNLSKWKVLANPKELVLTKEYNLISMFVNPKTQMFSLKFAGNKDLMGIKAESVDAIILSKDKLTIIGDFKGDDKK